MPDRSEGEVWTLYHEGQNINRPGSATNAPGPVNGKKVPMTRPTLWTDTPCVPFGGHVGTNGYGLAKNNGKTVLAHRLAYEREVGPIPEGHHVHHLCRMPACVNPKHLMPLTPKEHLALRGPNTRTRSDASLSDAQADELRALYEAGEGGYGELGRRFGVSRWVVRNIIKGRSYV